VGAPLPNLPVERGTVNYHTPQHINPKKGQHPDQKLEGSAQSTHELRRNPLLSIKRKKFGQHILKF
jgi:hypothetical protein